MRSGKMGLSVLVCLLVVFSTSLGSRLPMVSVESRVLAQTVDGKKAEADRLYDEGFKLFHTIKFEAALHSLEQALKIYREIKDNKGEGKVLRALGTTHAKMGNNTKAIEYTQQALTIARQIKDPQEEGKTLSNLGTGYINLGDYGKAIEYTQQALTIARQIKDPQEEGTALGNLGLTYIKLRDYSKAIEYTKQALTIARQIKDPQTEVVALNSLGNAYIELGEYAKAIEYTKQALTITRQIKDPQKEAAVLGNLGLAHINLGDYGKAIEYQQQALIITRQIKDPQNEVLALVNLGIAYINLGDYGKAIEYQQQALIIARQIKDPQNEGKILNGLGNAYHNLVDYIKAIEYTQQALIIARQIKDPEGEAYALGNLGAVYNSVADYGKSIEYTQQWLTITRQIKDPQGEGKALGNLGLAYINLGDYGKAIEYQQQALIIARQIKDPQGEGKALGNLGFAYRNQGDYAKSIEYYQQVLTIARQIKDPKMEGVALNNLGNVLRLSGKLSEAEKILLSGIKVWESLRQILGNNDVFKISIFEQQIRTYRLLQKVLIAQNKTDKGLEISERGKARAFVELLERRIEANQKAKYTPPEPTIEQIKQIAKEQNATLVQYSIIYDDFKVAEQQQKQTQESELYIWVIKPTGEIIFRKADLKPLWQKEKTNLEELVKTSRQSIGVRGAKMENPPPPDPEKQKKRLQKLYEILISPIADLLPKKETDKVVFIPQSSLFLVPFPALQDENGKYLIDKHTILTSPSIQVLDLTKKQYQKLGNQALQTNNMLIVGNPIMPKVTIKIGDKPQKLSPLPYAEKEAIAIANLFKTQPLIGKQATESTVVERLPQAQIIHFATHGLFDDIRGLDSSIALTSQNPNSLSSPLSKEQQKRDGLLTAEEIFGLELKANLVVLSACDTGRGKITGDGVIGLSRSFISAGVPSVIVSLWSVDDGSTAFLMTEFYQNLQQKMDKATALRKAMLDTRKKYSSPSQWAAFTLIGESE